MDRLTKTYEDGSHGVANNLPCGENSYDFKNLLIDVLGAYEDIGLTPEQLLEVDKMYTEKCREVAELKKKQTPMKPIKNRTQEIRYTSAYSCPNCGGGFAGTGIADYCYHCGQRLDWEGGNEI